MSGTSSGTVSGTRGATVTAAQMRVQADDLQADILALEETVRAMGDLQEHGPQHHTVGQFGRLASRSKHLLEQCETALAAMGDEVFLDQGAGTAVPIDPRCVV
jgi:hypothetical protein